MLLFEPVVEALSYSLDVESRPDPPGYIDDGEVGLVAEREEEVLEFLDERFPRLIAMVDVQTRTVGASGLALDPLPVLGGAVARGENDQVFSDRFGDDLLDLLPCRMVRKDGVCGREVLVGAHSALVCDSAEVERTAGDVDLGGASSVIPAEILDEKSPEVEVLQVLPDFVPVECGWHSIATDRPGPGSR